MLTSTHKAFVVATGNVLVVALAFAISEATRPQQVFPIFLAMSFAGLFLSIVPVLVIGRVAGRLRRARLPILMALAFATVAGLGLCTTLVVHDAEDGYLFLRLIPLAGMPTAAAAAILERWTRPAPAITSATVLSGSNSGSRESHPSRTTSCT